MGQRTIWHRNIINSLERLIRAQICPRRGWSQTDTIILHYGAIRDNENVIIDIIESS